MAGAAEAAGRSPLGTLEPFERGGPEGKGLFPCCVAAAVCVLAVLEGPPLQ